MKIAVMSDSHDNWHNLEQAVNISNELKCEYLLFAGDLMASSGIKILKKFLGKVIIVLGNNEGDHLAIKTEIDQTKNILLTNNPLNGRGVLYEGEIEGRKIIMYHYPRLMEIAAKSEEFDLCIFGHTHELIHKKIGKTLLLNPGNLRGKDPLNNFPATFCIVDLKDLSITIKEIHQKN